MKQPANNYRARIVDLGITIITLLLAAVIINQCLEIYLTGISPENLTQSGVRIHDIFTPEIVAQRAQAIAPFFVMWLIVLMATIIWRVRNPVKAKIPGIPAEYRLILTRARTVENESMQRQVVSRRWFTIALIVILAVCAAMVIVYLADMNHFASRDLEYVMGQMLIHVVPWVSLAFIALFIWEKLCERSMYREIEAAKGAARRDPERDNSPRRPYRSIAVIALYAAAAAFIVMGVLNGGMYDVLVKAINICTECVGLG
ncbi:MAG: CD1871A family CXXC motif-containing protein [Clostridia bacterium]|nr:CD1871A family CXXC motif-containing protein [Clostridia bacterium]